MDEGPEPHAGGRARPGERLIDGVEDLTEAHEGIDAPIRGHAEDVQFEKPDALLGFQRPGALVDEAVFGKTSQEERAAQRALVEERRIGGRNEARVEMAGEGEEVEFPDEGG